MQGIRVRNHHADKVNQMQSRPNNVLNYVLAKPAKPLLCFVGIVAVISYFLKPKNAMLTKLAINARLDHNVAPKQIINPASPAQEEQLQFIAEGGNSQP